MGNHLSRRSALLPPCGERRARGGRRVQYRGAVEERELLVVWGGVGRRRAAGHPRELVFEGALTDWLAGGVGDRSAVAVPRVAGGEHHRGEPVVGGAVQVRQGRHLYGDEVVLL